MTTTAERAERMAWVEDQLSRKISTRMVIGGMKKRFGAAPRTAKRYVHDVRKRWREEGTSEVRGDIRRQRRDSVRASIEYAVALAFSKTETVEDAQGNPILDPRTGHPLQKSNPDLQRALMGLRHLMDLDGLQAPARVQIEQNVAIGLEPRRFESASTDSLREFLQTGKIPDPPDNVIDIGKKKLGAG